MTQSLTVLVTSAGSRASLLDCFRESAQQLGVDLRVVAADMRPSLSAACAKADRSFFLPPCSDPSYGGALLELCERNRVDLVVPTIDPELAPLSEISQKLRSQRTRAVVSDRATIALVRNKLETAEHFLRKRVPVPRTAWAASALEDLSSWSWPLFAKPVDGSRSVGSSKVQSPLALKALMEERGGLIVQELCGGDEYTVNLYIAEDGGLSAVVPHRRIEVRDGEVFKGITVKDERLQSLARSVAASLPGLRGPLCFQTFMERTKDAIPRVTDVNARFGGGYPLAHAAGGTFTTFLLREALGETLEPGPCDFEEGLLMLRHSSEIFVPQRVRERVS